MDILFFLLFLISIVTLFIGLIKPRLVIRWGNEEKKNRKNVFKIYGLSIIVFFVLFLISIPSSNNTIEESIDNNEAIKEDKEIAYSKEIEQIDSTISDTFKGKNHTIKMEGEEGDYKVLIAFDTEDNRFLEPIWCGINGLGFLDGIKYYHPELDEKISTYELLFFAEDSQTYSTEVDNTDSTEIKKLDLVSEVSDEVITVTTEDVKKYQEAERERQEAEKEIKEKEEKEKYNTSITVKDIARDKDGLKGSLVTFSGRIIQVIPGNDFNQYRMAVNDDYDEIIIIEIADELLDMNILEDDYITIQGVSVGNIEYLTVLGDKRTVPGVKVDHLILE